MRAISNLLMRSRPRGTQSCVCVYSELSLIRGNRVGSTSTGPVQSDLP